ncbi:hypothetical protein [Methylicorpusculum sp.]|uniref:hypothetical protein n=1 Tax=Methylicorpusculum sp. TaxID=2713644 RepID=UPI00273121E9|nr:hypothetical protein [Methylicorpusculum sp.]MDP2178738.1 hypothetical protein [Methylicorpusculum sp.]MDZ4150288.1 hypothetical protein [Methylicorpusculum sp.]
MSTQNTPLGKVTLLVTDEVENCQNKVTRTPIRNAWVTLRSKQVKGKVSKESVVQQKNEESMDELSCEEKVYRKETDEKGIVTFDVPYGAYESSCEAFGVKARKDNILVNQDDSCYTSTMKLPLGFCIDWGALTDDCHGTEFNQCVQADAGTTWIFKVYDKAGISPANRRISWSTTGGNFYESDTESDTVYLDTHNHTGKINVSATMSEIGSASLTAFLSFLSKQKPVNTIGGNLDVSLTRTETSFTEDLAFWTGIRNSTEALSFNNYLGFMDWIFCGGKLPPAGFESERFPVKKEEYKHLISKRFLPFSDSDAYRVIKAATEAFVMVNCGVQQSPLPFDPDLNRPNRDDAYLDRRDLPIPISGLKTNFEKYLVPLNGKKTLPYLAVIRRKLPDIPIKSVAFEDAVPVHGEMDREMDNCFGLLQEKLENPCLLELIWSYWHEEGMLVQSMNAITLRFQNIRSPAFTQDPLANLEMEPLRPLNNLLWGYIQDEQHRLTVGRRNNEYDHHYGLRLEGKAVKNFRPVDTRSKFLEAFHNLLRLCTVFYKQDDDTTVKADAFPVLNGLKEVHLILSQGAHNQFGDLPSTARIEMLMQQWLLARPEFREYLPTRIMVAYPEPWMDRVDAMKKLQGWTDTSVLHFRNLGMFGEQLLLSIRWGHWSDEFEPVKALNWARFFRPQVQGYIHAYRAATGVDLSADPSVNAHLDSMLPSVLLQKRLASQQRVG